MKIGDLMTKNVVSVRMDDPLSTVRDLFDRHRFHHLLVVESGKLVGVVSDRDLLKALSPKLGTLAESERDAATLHKRVHQIMTRGVMALYPDASVQAAVDIFNAHRVSCIPIVNNDGQAVGIVSWRDLLKAFAAHLK